MRHLITVLPIVVVVLAVLYMRVRRTMTAQPVRAPMMISRIIMLALLGALVGGGLIATGPTIGGIVAGIVVGIGGAFFSLQHTQWDTTGSEIRYKANPYIGSVVVALVLIRIVMDLATLSRGGSSVLVTQSPLTLALYYLFVAYWIVYYMGIVRHTRTLAPKLKRG